MAATETFGRRIRAARLARGLSLADLADGVNARTGGMVSRQIVSGWEHDYRYAPSAEVLIAVAEVLGLDPVALLHAAGKVHPAVADALDDEAYHRDALALALARTERVDDAA